MTAPIRPGLDNRPVVTRVAEKGRPSKSETSGSAGARSASELASTGAASRQNETPLARALVSLEMRVSQAIRTTSSTGVEREETRTATLSVRALADLFDVEAQRPEPPPSPPEGTPPTEGDAALDPAGLSPSPGDLLEKLRAAFTPERTAGRIVDFALSGFAASETRAAFGDNEAGRQKFVDLMQKAVDQGFAEAKALFGELPEETQAELADTAVRVRDGFSRFVAQGLDPSKSTPGGVYERARRAQFSVEIEATAVESRRTAYNQKGGAVANDPAAQSRVLVSA